MSASRWWTSEGLRQRPKPSFVGRIAVRTRCQQAPNRPRNVPSAERDSGAEPASALPCARSTKATRRFACERRETEGAKYG